MKAVFLALGIAATTTATAGDLGKLRQPVTAMEPTIKKDQVVTASPLPVGRSLAIGEIVVFKMPSQPEKLDLKRIVGIAGDAIEFRDKALYRNGKQVQESYVVHRDYKVYQKGMPKDLEMYVTRDQFPPHKVAKGSVFVLGDNRDESWDSRFFGDIPISTIVGYVKEPK